MIITKKALPAPDVSPRDGGRSLAALAGRHGAVADRTVEDARQARAAGSVSSTCRWAATSRAGHLPARPF